MSIPRDRPSFFSPKPPSLPESIGWRQCPGALGQAWSLEEAGAGLLLIAGAWGAVTCFFALNNKYLCISFFFFSNCSISWIQILLANVSLGPGSSVVRFPAWWRRQVYKWENALTDWEWCYFATGNEIVALRHDHPCMGKSLEKKRMRRVFMGSSFSFLKPWVNLSWTSCVSWWEHQMVPSVTVCPCPKSRIFSRF